MTPEVIDGNLLVLLRSGVEYFPALISAIDAAREEIYLETYLFEDDATGRCVAAALCAAATRSVAVHLMIDGFGAKDLPEELRQRLRSSGVQLLVYRPVISRLTLRRQRLRRLHRKVVVIDREIAFVGGINIIDDMDTPGHTPPRFDYAVQIKGPLLRPIHASTAQLWRHVALAHLRRRAALSTAVDASPKGTQRAAFVTRDNVNHRRDIETAYLTAIASARHEIIIANAYFFPGRRFREALIAAAARGVRVGLVLQGRVEYRLLHYATQALYGKFLAAGIEIYEYRKSFLHAKVAVIDEEWATVGSSNIDPFSLMLAREANVVVEDRPFALELRDSLIRAMEDGARIVVRARWLHRSWAQRALSWICYRTVRLLMGLAGYGAEV